MTDELQQATGHKQYEARIATLEAQVAEAMRLIVEMREQQDAWYDPENPCDCDWCEGARKFLKESEGE